MKAERSPTKDRRPWLPWKIEGSYTLQVLNTLTGCTSSDELQVTSETPYELTFQTEDASCITERGSIVFEEVLGGLAPYVYSVDGGESFSSAPGLQQS